MVQGYDALSIAVQRDAVERLPDVGRQLLADLVGVHKLAVRGVEVEPCRDRPGQEVAFRGSGGVYGVAERGVVDASPVSQAGHLAGDAEAAVLVIGVADFSLPCLKSP